MRNSVVIFVSKVLVGLLAVSGLTMLGSLPAQATSCPITPPAPGYQLPAGTIVNGDVFTVCDFRGWDFSLQNANNVNFEMSYLAGANFTNSTFTNSQFGNNSNHNVNFTGANLSGSRIWSDFSSSNFDHTNLTNANLHFAHLDGANLVDANLTNANMNNVFLDGASLAYANLSGADLTDAYLRGANLTNNTGTAASQSQLAVAQLNELTICPDSYPLGMHVGDCFGPLTAPTATTTPPVVGSTGFTFDITNNFIDYYTFTVAVTSGPGVATSGTPSGNTLPISVTGAPPGSDTIVTITATTLPSSGSLVKTTTYNYQEEVAKELARTGLREDNTTQWLLGGVTSIFLGAGVYFYSRRSRRHGL